VSRRWTDNAGTYAASGWYCRALQKPKAGLLTVALEQLQFFRPGGTGDNAALPAEMMMHVKLSGVSGPATKDPWESVAGEFDR
jgi:hypothetical protein